MRKTSVIYIIIFSLLFLYLFAIYDIKFSGPDSPIYLAYTKSIVDDGDLNAVDNIYNPYAHYIPSLKIGVSKTYNFPDYHNHGGVIFWSPFYLYAKAVNYMRQNSTPINKTNYYSPKKIIHCVMSFSTVIFGFITVMLTFMLCRMFFSNKIAIGATLAMFFGTPFFYYMLFETANGNMVASLLSVVSIFFYSFIIKKKRIFWLLYGLFFSICIAVKVDLWFQIFFIFTFAILNLTIKQISWGKGLFFIIGLLPGIILLKINDFIRYGTIHTSQFGLISFKDCYFFDQLFSSYHGFFYTSPIFYICFFGLICIILNLKKNTKSEDKTRVFFILALAVYLIIKIIVLGYRFAWGGGSCGARLLLTEFPVFVLLFARVFQKQNGALGNYLLCFFTLVCISWNLLIISEYLSGIDLTYIAKAPGLDVRIVNLKEITNLLFSPKELCLKLKFCIPLLGAFVLIFYMIGPFMDSLQYLWHKNEQYDYRFSNLICLFTIYLCTAYLLVTLLNIKNNKRNVERLKKEGFFNNAYIIGIRDYEKAENVNSMNEMIDYFGLKGNIDRVNKIRRIKGEIYGR